MDWWFPLKFLMASFLWGAMYVGDHIFERNIQTSPITISDAPADAVLVLAAGGPLPPGAYIQTKQNAESVCETVPTLGAAAIAILRDGKWELNFPYAEVGVYISGNGHGCNIAMSGSIIVMTTGKYGIWVE